MKLWSLALTGIEVEIISKKKKKKKKKRTEDKSHEDIKLNK